MPSSSNKTQAAAVAEQEQLPCPRCESNNTKFCYYNNYNFAQPRYFCKACRRYWTQGGTLRNVPIGGGSRSKTSNKRTRTCTSPFTTSVPQPPISFNFPPTSSFTSLLNAQVPEFVGLGFDNFGYNNNVGIGGVWPSFMSFGSVGIGGGGGGGDAWPQLGNDCFVWPDLAISAPRKCLK